MGFWAYLIGALLIFLFFKEGVMKKYEALKEWWDLNKGKIVEWEKNQAIMAAFRALKTAIEKAKLDRRWDLGEILLVLGLAGKLISLIKQYEEENG